LLGSLFLASCSSADGYGPADGPVGAAEGRIAFGTPDSKHTAVVTVLEPAGSNEFAECSGSIVKVSGGKATVLTAAHCCNTNAPTIVSASADYTAGEQALFGGPINPPVYAVDASSIYYDAQFDMSNLQNGHDFCMFQFATSASLPTLALPPSCPNDGVADGVQVEHVGFGETDTNMNNTGRNTGTDAITSFDANTISWDQGDAAPSHAGTCEGDSGGPALTPAGAAQSAQIIVATTSFGGNVACGASNVGTGARVCTEMGSGGFISSYLAGTPIGSTPGTMSAATCDTCAQSSESGACATQAQACANDPACITLNMCVGNCAGSQSCDSACASTAGQTAVNELNAFGSCVCSACSSCSSQCCGSSSSSSGGGGCGLMSSAAACNTCLDASCCGQAAACAADQTCLGCLTATPAASCQSDGAYVALAECLNGSCASPCGGGSSSSSSSSGSSTTSSSTSASSGSATTSSGSMSSGNGGGGGGSAGTSGNGAAAGTSSGGVISTKGGCSVEGGGTDAGGGAGPFAGLLLALGVAASRRRRG
jgi:hypothetical protein